MLLLGLAVVSALGCGGPKAFAPVSGKVMMDGKALPNASVSFAPIPPEGSHEAGVPSTGTTNENGEFTLQGVNGKDGAQIGMHIVSISVINAEVGGGDVRGGPPLVNKVPPKYNDNSVLKFEVMPGNNEANFLDLKSK
jgi:hypothetical protein